MIPITEEKRPAQKVEAKPCPSCGHCPTCGHSPHPAPPQIVPMPYPVYPRPWDRYIPRGPVWSGTGFVTRPSTSISSARADTRRMFAINAASN